jgi:transcriptional regulator with XRE-family HTH domain
VDDVRVGQWVRSERRRKGLRQADVARLAGVSSQTVLTVEHGRLAHLSLHAIRAVARAVAIELPFGPRSIHGRTIDRQVDSRHAALVDRVVTLLRDAGWTVEVEWPFNHYGDRGSVDVLAWHPTLGSLLLIEVKSELRNVQDTLRALHVKRGVVPRLLAQERGWRPRSLGVVLVVPEIRAERDRIDRHGATFASALPARTVEVKRWIADPSGRLSGVWFLQIPRTTLAMQKRNALERVRVSEERRLEGVSGDSGPDSGPDLAGKPSSRPRARATDGPAHGRRGHEIA